MTLNELYDYVTRMETKAKKGAANWSYFESGRFYAYTDIKEKLEVIIKEDEEK